MAKVITLGEILMRLSTTPGQMLDNMSTLDINYGGSEANVAIGLASFNHEVSFVTYLPNNDLGKGVIRHLKQFDVDTNHIVQTDMRLGTYYVETGVGNRATSVVYDRSNSGFSELKEFPWDFDDIFSEATLFHVSGITPALSHQLVEFTILCMKEAKKRGLLISFDSNYRSKLWSFSEAKEAYQRILPYVDFCSMGKLDAINILGVAKPLNNLTDQEELSYYCEKIKSEYPEIKLFYSTIRQINSSNDNELTGTIWKDGTLVVSKKYHMTYIVDRIGGGDAFSAGILHGLLSDKTLQEIVDFGTANAVLKHTVVGDVANFSEEVVDQFIQMDSSKINR